MTRLARLGPRLATVDISTAKVPPKTADKFYLSPEWRALLARLIRQRGRRCEHCGRTQGDDGKPIRLVGDHVVEIKDGGALLDPANIMLLDFGCHARKTAAARAERMAVRHRRG